MCRCWKNPPDPGHDGVLAARLGFCFVFKTFLCSLFKRVLQLFGKRKWNNHWHRNYRPTEVRNGLRSGRNRKLGAKKCVRKLFIHPIRCSRKRRTERLPQPLMCGCDMRKARRRFQYIYEVEVEKSDNCGEISCEEGAAKRTLFL